MVVLSPRGRERERERGGGGGLWFLCCREQWLCVCVCVCVWIYGGSSVDSVAPEVCLLLTACQCVELKMLRLSAASFRGSGVLRVSTQ